MRPISPFPPAPGLTRSLGLGLTLSALMGILAGCAAQAPDAGAQQQAAQARESELAGEPASIERLAPPQPLSSLKLDATAPAAAPMRSPASSTTAQSGTGSDIAAQTAAALAASSGADPAAPAPVTTSTGLSAENDFSAVSESRSIESDADRIASNRAQYTVIEPTELPERSGSAQPNIVAYALANAHPRGTRIYSRSGVNMQARAARNCAAFASADLAQIEFLANGGPQRDGDGLDPDGDGYACSWDPAPFRRAVDN
ncbi:hypothetical protein ACFMPD_10145 [Sedimentitalea sp. HM32M-2]|uniref:hypothetical protein n=1 Tax=Sedimentitalea sp. HM32M-2 TaxID=3351566 RepID=UPI0036258493